MSLPEKKVRALIQRMNSVSKFHLPAVKPLLDCDGLVYEIVETLSALIEEKSRRRYHDRVADNQPFGQNL